jgi:hypothetical protein
MSILALREARRHVCTFTDEAEIMRNHREAMECHDCEAFLQLGIDAFNWLVRADQTIRKAVFSGGEYDAEADEAIQELFKAWLKPCAFANQWIAVQEQRHYHLANLEEFRKCEQEVRSIVKAMEKDELTDAMRELRDSAVMEHRNGETAEFI